MIPLSFHQTKAEFMVRVASTLLFETLTRNGSPPGPLSDLTEKPQYGFTASATGEPVGPRFVRITDLQDGRVEWDKVPYCSCPQPQQYRLVSNDLLFARTGATTGKTYLVSDPQDAIYASYLIRVRPKTGVDPRFLHAFFQSDAYWRQIVDRKEGSAQPNVNGKKLAALRLPQVSERLQRAIAEFLTVVRQRQDGDAIPLPTLPAPLAEQGRIVAKIEQLATKIDAVRRLRAAIRHELDATLRSAFVRISAGAPRKKIADVAPLERRPVEIAPDGEYPELGVRSFGRGVFHKSVLHGVELTWHKLFRVHEGDIVISNIKAWEGAIAVGRAEDDGRVGSHRYLTLVPAKGTTTPGFLCFYLLSAEGLSDVGHASPGSADRNRTLGQKALQEIEVPVPSYQKQTWFERLQANVDGLKALQEKTATELDALLPSILDKAFEGEL